MTKVLTIVGTRPEIIRLSTIMRKLDKFCDHVIFNTNQNKQANMNNDFWYEFDLKPKYDMVNMSKNLGGFIGRLSVETEKILNEEKPDKVLILGDTNSALSSIVCERLGYPVYHMEAGNRCFDLSVPEEKNRKIIDAVSTYNLPYTQYSRENLLKEGFNKQNIFVTGNPIFEVMGRFSKNFYQRSQKIGQNIYDHQKYILATFHRAENVYNTDRLKTILQSLQTIIDVHGLPVIVSTHPTTRRQLEQEDFKAYDDNDIYFSEPFGFEQFLQLEYNAKLVLTDSGTVQEECAIFKTPVVVMRESTERHECMETGNCILAGVNFDKIVDSVTYFIERDKSQSFYTKPEYKCPEGYKDSNVSDKVVSLLVGK